MNVFLIEIKYLKEQLIAGEIIPDHSLMQTVLVALPESYQTFASTWRLGDLLLRTDLMLSSMIL